MNIVNQIASFTSYKTPNGLYKTKGSNIGCDDDTKEKIKFLLSGGEKDWYSTFPIPKKNGGVRIIETPKGKDAFLEGSDSTISELQIVQKKIANVLLQTPLPHTICAYRNIDYLYSLRILLSKIAAGKAKSINSYFKLDIKNYFPSITHEQVILAFEYFYKNIIHTIPSKEVLETLAKLTCNGDHLPQGAPTSPMIANIVAYLTFFSKIEGVIYKYRKNLKNFDFRIYADDFFILSESDITEELQKEIIQSITSSGFNISEKKRCLETNKEGYKVLGVSVLSQFQENHRIITPHSASAIGQFTFQITNSTDIAHATEIKKLLLGDEANTNKVKGLLRYNLHVSKFGGGGIATSIGFLSPKVAFLVNKNSRFFIELLKN
ncbi:MAG: reverse transcriptase domain-containing protein [Candidatus Gracilibacteria bacterium]|nr:reverse transcriptase domain-containing protein [Candidatus Gracilibacteria bacterium]